MKLYVNFPTASSDHQRSLIEKTRSFLEKSGHDVYSLVNENDDLQSYSSHLLKARSKQWHAFINDCDCAIFEGSYPSNIHTGFELGLLASRGKPILLLYKNTCDPVFINNHYATRIIKSEYTNDSLNEVIKWCLEEVSKIINRRFTFFIPPEIDSFLEQIAHDKNISRSEYIRMLIEQEMKD